MNRQEIIDRIARLNDLIKMLRQDIECFGPAGDDIARIQAYKKELSQLNLSLQPPDETD